MNPVWSKSRLIAYPASVVDFSKVAAPLLTGFSLTAIVQLVGRDARGLHGDFAIMFLALAAGLLISAIQAGLTAATYQASPADRLAWTPEARVDADASEAVRSEQWADESLAVRYRARAQYCYNFGIVALLLGLVFVLVPGPGDWSVPRILGIVAASLAVLVELVGIFEKPEVVRRLILPTLDDLDRERARRASLDPPPLTSTELQQAITGGPGLLFKELASQGTASDGLIAARVAEIEKDVLGK